MEFGFISKKTKTNNILDSYPTNRDKKNLDSYPINEYEIKYQDQIGKERFERPL